MATVRESIVVGTGRSHICPHTKQRERERGKGTSYKSSKPTPQRYTSFSKDPLPKATKTFLDQTLAKDQVLKSSSVWDIVVE